MSEWVSRSTGLFPESCLVGEEAEEDGKEDDEEDGEGDGYCDDFVLSFGVSNVFVYGRHRTKG